MAMAMSMSMSISMPTQCKQTTRSVIAIAPQKPGTEADSELTNSPLSGPKSCKLVFVYGTLKKGFGNHWLMEELTSDGHAQFLGYAQTKDRFPLVCGPFQVPFLLNFPSRGAHVRGEVYQADREAIARLDELEGVERGHYIRHPLVLSSLRGEKESLQNGGGCITLSPTSSPSLWSRSADLLAEAYFASPAYSHGMASAAHIDSYSEKEAATYVKRRDRPQNRTFLEHVYAWIESRLEAPVPQPKPISSL